MDPFETERLIVRQFTPADADDFFLLNSSEQTMRYIRPIKNREESDAFLEENFNLYLEGFPYGRMLVAEKDTGNFVGTFSILYLDGDADYHIGYALMPAAWGKGYASELVLNGSKQFFVRTTHDALFAITDPENLASAKVLLKNQFIPFGEFFLDQKSMSMFKLTRTEFNLIHSQILH
ncbi:MAG: GNAT family N-acetyltransferase [Chitinophagaceae bacterium]|nr:GNAT family N-acetyltransferase [Chitinophagaceae bacterium]